MVKILEFNSYDENDNVVVEKIPVSVSFSAIKNFQKHTGKSITNVNDDLEDLFILQYYSYLAGCKLSKHKGYSVKYDLDEFEIVFDGTFEQFMKVMHEFFPDNSKKKQVKK